MGSKLSSTAVASLLRPARPRQAFTKFQCLHASRAASQASSVPVRSYSAAVAPRKYEGDSVPEARRDAFPPSSPSASSTTPPSTPSAALPQRPPMLGASTPDSRNIPSSVRSAYHSEQNPSALASSERPRWSYTPPAMRAPVSLRPKTGLRFAVNENTAKLDTFYDRLLGEGGSALLSEEAKWLAITHKSFDQGRRGYNDRLAFFGKRIVNLQVSLALLNRSDGSFFDPPDPYQRERFQHPGIDLLPRLTPESRLDSTSRGRIAHVGGQAGMLPIIRWKPRLVDDLAKSGSEQVMAQAVYAIVGAVALQRGGEVAARIVRDRIIKPLGL